MGFEYMSVIEEGRISKDNTQYCYAMAFTCGIQICAEMTKSGTYVFSILDKLN